MSESLREMARELAYENDESEYGYIPETPEHRWTRIRAWVAENLITPLTPADPKTKERR